MDGSQARAGLSISIVNSVNAVSRILRRRAVGGGEIGLGELGILKAVASFERVRPSTIAEALGQDLSVISRRLTALDAAGLTAREADPSDRRAQVVVLTPAGAERLSTVSPGPRPRAGADGEPDLGALGILQAVASHERARPSTIADTLGQDLSVISRRLTALEGAGLVERIPDPDDGRSRFVALTEAGAERLAALSTVTGQAIATRLGDWDTADLERLARLLSRLEQDLAGLVR